MNVINWYTYVHIGYKGVNTWNVFRTSKRVKYMQPIYSMHLIIAWQLLSAHIIRAERGEEENKQH